MGLMGKASLFLVLSGLTAGVVLNVLVVTSCEYLQGRTQNGDALQLGVFRYSLDQEGSPWDTGGDCDVYENDALVNNGTTTPAPAAADVDLEWQVKTKTARAFAIIAP